MLGHYHSEYPTHFSLGLPATLEARLTIADRYRSLAHGLSISRGCFVGMNADDESVRISSESFSSVFKFAPEPAHERLSKGTHENGLPVATERKVTLSTRSQCKCGVGTP